MIEKYKTSKKKGMSLIEMIVAISIFTMGIAGFTMLFLKSWKSNSFILEEGMASSQASQTVTNISGKLREIRQPDTGEYMIKTANENELVIYVNEDADSNIERVRYFLDGTNHILKKGVAEASGSPLSYPADYSSDTINNLASYVMNSGGSEPVFKYYDNTNTQLSASPTPTNIRVIEINLWINIKPLSAPENVKIGTSVELRNLDESI